LAILFARRIGMARPWFLDGILDGNQRVPAALIVHGFEAMETAEPARHFRPCPQAAVIGRRLKPFFQRRKRFWRKDRGRRAVTLPPVAQAVRSLFVVALAEQPNPAP